MSRGERWALAAAALVLGGCMRIYPDPELPDVVVEWHPDFDCAAEGESVVVSLSTIEPAAEVRAATAPCRDGTVRFDDLERLRYLALAKLEDGAGEELGRYEDDDVDLRKGLSRTVFPFFGRPPTSNFRVAWSFDMGASCESLSVTLLEIRATLAGGGPTFPFDAPCDAAVLVDALPLDGTYTLTARAVGADGVVAVSPASAPLPVTRAAITDFGTLTLSPCGTACPPLEPE